MYSKRYGDLNAVGAWTDGDCHLCLEPLDLSLYGPTGHYGAETVTVDHLHPQSHGGEDTLSNLRLAHGTCNSVRGTRSVWAARHDLAGTIVPPRTSSEKTALAISAASLAALAAGYGLARHTAHGDRVFNGVPALAVGLLVFAAVRYGV